MPGQISYCPQDPAILPAAPEPLLDLAAQRAWLEIVGFSHEPPVRDFPADPKSPGYENYLYWQIQQTVAYALAFYRKANVTFCNKQLAFPDPNFETLKINYQGAENKYTPGREIELANAIGSQVKFSHAAAGTACDLLHELGHWILHINLKDSQAGRYHITLPAFEEAFSDVFAITVMLQHPRVAARAASEIKSNQSSCISRVCPSYAYLLGCSQRESDVELYTKTSAENCALRELDNSWSWPPEKSDRELFQNHLTCAPYSLSRLLSGALFEVMRLAAGPTPTAARLRTAAESLGGLLLAALPALSNGNARNSVFVELGEHLYTLARAANLAQLAENLVTVFRKRGLTAPESTPKLVPPSRHFVPLGLLRSVHGESLRLGLNKIFASLDPGHTGRSDLLHSRRSESVLDVARLGGQTAEGIQTSSIPHSVDLTGLHPVLAGVRIVVPLLVSWQLAPPARTTRRKRGSGSLLVERSSASNQREQERNIRAFVRGLLARGELLLPGRKPEPQQRITHEVRTVDNHQTLVRVRYD